MEIFDKIFRNKTGTEEERMKDYLKTSCDKIKDGTDRINNAIHVNKSIKGHYSIEAKRYETERDNCFRKAQKYRESGNEIQMRKYLANAIRNDKWSRNVDAKIDNCNNEINFKLIPLRSKLREAQVLIDHALYYNKNPSTLLSDAVTKSLKTLEEINKTNRYEEKNYIFEMNKYFEEDAQKTAEENEISMEEVSDDIEEHEMLEKNLEGCSNDMKMMYKDLTDYTKEKKPEPSEEEGFEPNKF